MPYLRGHALTTGNSGTAKEVDIMARRSVAAVAIAVVVLGGAGALVGFAQVRDRASTASGRYRVTSWPDHTDADKPYATEVEAHLNRMAAEGWKFQADLVGQTARMMVFERDR